MTTDRVSKDHTLAILDDLRTRNRTALMAFHVELKVNVHAMVDRFFQGKRLELQAVRNEWEKDWSCRQSESGPLSPRNGIGIEITRSLFTG